MKTKTFYSLLPDYQIPYMQIKNKEGPHVVITAGIHACEYVGMITCYQLFDEIEEKDIQGTLTIIPIVNVQGFYQRSVAVNPIDQINLNRCFNIEQPETYSQKIVKALEEKIIKTADYYFDLHSGDLQEDLLPHLYYSKHAKPEIIAKCKEIAQAVNCPYAIASSSWHSSHVGGAVNGVVSLLIERGGLGLRKDDDIQAMKKDIYHLLIKIGLIEGNIFINETQIRDISCDEMIAQHSGRLDCFVKVGDKIKPQQLVARITGLDDEIYNYYSEVYGTVIYHSVAYGCQKPMVLLAYTIEKED